MYYLSMPKKAFTLIEILVVTAIVSILSVTLVYSFLHQRDKAINARIKSDLSHLQIAFENYYNDNNCYPPTSYFDDASDCGSNALAPYLPTIPCSPRSSLPYVLEKDGTGCVWYKLYGTLIDPASDSQALTQYSLTGSTLGNYGVSSSNTHVSVYFPTSASSSSSPSSSSIPGGYYWCSTNNNCTSYDPNQWSCTPSYPNPNCGTGCVTSGFCVHH